MSEYILALTTVPDEDKGRELAHLVVEARLAACAKVSASCLSVYHWEGKVIDDREWVLTIVTKQSLYPALEEKIRAYHPYKVPEIVALPILEGSLDYLRWIEAETD
ncbi:MAG: divalent-cation tolerance protein CutA [Candidatus Aminicenantales bacterium]|jgi:periplasmic divalent cation tolerance protein